MIEADMEIMCRTCKHFQVELEDEPCYSCLCYDHWEKSCKTAEESIRDWERRVFDEDKRET